MKGKQHVLEMVPILYFSVVTRGKIITFGHKFLAMAQKAYVITQPGSLLHLSHGKIILCEFNLFCQKLQNINIFSSCYRRNPKLKVVPYGAYKNGNETGTTPRGVVIVTHSTFVFLFRILD